MKAWAGFCGNVEDASLTLELNRVSFHSQTVFGTRASALCSPARKPTGILCLQYSFIQPWATFPRTERMQKTKSRSDAKLPLARLKKWQQARHPRGEEFKSNRSVPEWDRKCLVFPIFFYRKGTVCRTAALECSPDGSLSRLKNKRESLREQPLPYVYFPDMMFTETSAHYCFHK